MKDFNLQYKAIDSALKQFKKTHKQIDITSIFITSTVDYYTILIKYKYKEFNKIHLDDEEYLIYKPVLEK